MRAESIVFALAGTFFGLLVGWILGSQGAGPAVPGPAATVTASSETTTTPSPALDEQRVAQLRAAAQQNSEDAGVRVELGNLYFDAEQFTEAAKWYEEALQLDPQDVNVSTDLGVSYYYTNQPDRALAQFEQSLRVDSTHTKTLLNRGIVRAFGKQDLQGAMDSWQEVIRLAPDSAEARTAKQALDSLVAAHGGAGDVPAPPP